MPSLHNYLMFLGAATLLCLMPGPDTLYVLGRSMTQGRRFGVVSALGIMCGCWVHITAAAFGLSEFVVQSQTAFAVVRWLGALYLVYLGGLMLLRRPIDLHAADAVAAVSSGRAFWQGFLTNVLNPKVALFFLAFLPQFLDLERPTAPQVFILGGTFVALGTAWLAVLAMGGSALGAVLNRHPRARLAQERITGTVFMGLGLKLAFSSSTRP
jgi:threonine/homoserine/homoserine lactone efflux protein